MQGRQAPRAALWLSVQACRLRVDAPRLWASPFPSATLSQDHHLLETWKVSVRNDFLGLSVQESVYGCERLVGARWSVNLAVITLGVAWPFGLRRRGPLCWGRGRVSPLSLSRPWSCVLPGVSVCAESLGGM